MRTRSAAAATAVVTVALVVGAFGLLMVLHGSIVRAAQSTAAVRAEDVAAELVADGSVTSGLNLNPTAGEDEAHVQLLAAGQLVAASSTADQPTADVPDALAPGQVVDLAGTGPTVGVALGVGGVDGVDTVVVWQSYASGQEAVLDVVQALALGVPVLVALVGVTTYLLTGRALRPVEAIRRRSEQISEADDEARIDVPRSGDEIEALARTLNGMLERLHAAHASQLQFVADASHELRSPLAALRAELDVAERSSTNDWGRTARVVRSSGDRMQRLVEDLLVLTRAEERSATDRSGAVDLDAVVEEVGFGLLVPEGLSVRVDTAPVQVPGSADELHRAVLNLAENASRHARAHVRLTVREAGGSAVVHVDDDGPGIPVGAREEIFARFSRLDTGRARDTGGTGLGLAIVRGIAAAHGGEVHVGDSELGGARFTLTIPTGTEHARAARSGPSVPPPVTT
ncbi:two-component sensor histidine kinase [Cellulomonas soli]|uniref:histidine kinase n=1 Tax=Cellulomonas soli TaxID=931535 RepID=A0A512PHI0_9CELL|nr:two-component sensor histidine kinase [Cellulomonas soli]